ncbi:putative 20S proteasome subunit alpha type 2 [Lasiosphaeria hispida]|uniref:20S proteasome subunit alpha type 2 n=1 Tax=Lasiosphaeria hispida TaxID=260671 RepID=A0AAJ0H9U1_9PEZI|nr:putative 20S proteasome subunit alpha type 2 [Lasiosphaeria hispida]
MTSTWGELPSLAAGGDGTGDRVRKRGTRPVAAIFIHAGAGYHSVANEKVHLEACSEAARVGMRFLKAGATAPEAVEAAIKCLEDKEITNAGFGSNLNMDGVVECDATIVDHLGRSGACGAVPGIKNPISLAKIILDTSRQPLSLRRVPPNILVGIGAKLFAEEHGMATTLNEYLTSKNARDRYVRWDQDLKKAEAKLTPSASTASKQTETESGSPTPGDYEKAAIPAGATQRRDHTSAILTGTWNEGQPDSPYNSGTPVAEIATPIITTTPATARSMGLAQRTVPNVSKNTERGPLGFMSTAFQSRTSTSSVKRPRVQKSLSDDSTTYRSVIAGVGRALSPPASPHDGSVSAGDDLTDIEFQELLNALDKQTKREASSTTHPGVKRTASDASLDDDDLDTNPDLFDLDPGANLDPDLVTDTVGAIAIDLKGHIAAGSSSGGIGMKHRGRIGPAALVGIGTAVIPEDPDDDEQACVAAVTSGTGEHMATSLASAKCAERLFNGTRRGPGGRSVEELDEHSLMESFILDDFMGHPGVRNQPSTGAIGVMAVKKDRSGLYFYFAHNTDSFALASMSSAEREPLCVMSRLGKVRPVAQGGRKVRAD